MKKKNQSAKGSLTHLTGIPSQVVVAGGSILARVGHTFIHLLLAVAALVACLTATEMCVARVQTLARVTAQVSHLHTCERETKRERTKKVS